jgi:toxin ParE1/3/4
LIIRWLALGNETRFSQLNFVAAENPAAAEALDTEIERQVDRLADHPYLGRKGRQPGTRELVISRTPFIAVYRIKPHAIEILRILHGAQDWPRRRGQS